MRNCGPACSASSPASETADSPNQNHKIQPHRLETFKFSTDPQLEAKIRGVVGLYLSPPDNAVVVSVDEKSQIQALDRTAPMLPLRPGLPERRTP